jgi:hypothetical protein
MQLNPGAEDDRLPWGQRITPQELAEAFGISLGVNTLSDAAVTKEDDDSGESKEEGVRYVSVWARVRPLVPKELAAGGMPLAGAATSTGVGRAAVALTTSDGQVLDGFTGVFGPAESNAGVFERCFSDQVGVAAAGGTATLFCYGYTGSGKTHTILGYGEKGLHALATEKLLSLLPPARVQGVGTGDSKGEDADGLHLAVTAVEIYGDKVFDLGGASKVACVMQVDEDGVMQVMHPPMSAELSDLRPDLGLASGPSHRDSTVETGAGGGPGKSQHATLVTKRAGLTAVVVSGDSGAEGVAAATAGALASRAVGTSSEHDESSRSHAVLTVKVTTRAVTEAEEDLDAARAVLPAISNALGNLMMRAWDATMVPGSAATAKDPATGASLHTVLVRPFDPAAAPWRVTKAASDAQASALGKAQAEAEGRASQARARLAAARSRAGPSCGGRLVLVDLAGADYDPRSPSTTTTTPASARQGGVGKAEAAAEAAARRESIDINKSLLALKECLRSVAKAAGASPRPPFRQSKLTRLLEDALLPSRASGRRGLATATVMLVNVGPSAHQERMTSNALRYGQLWATAGAAAKATGGISGGGGGAASGGGGAGAATGEKGRPWTTEKAIPGTGTSVARAAAVKRDNR